MSDVMAILARGAQVLLALGGAYLVALWFASIIWAFRDVESRSRSVVTQIAGTLLPLLFPFIGIPVYLILRPKDTLDTAYQRSLEEEYLLQDLEELPLCPACQQFVEEDFVLCPQCHASLRHACIACERLVDLRWTLCPYCGTAQSDEKVIPAAEAPAARWTSPAKRRRSASVPAAAAAATGQSPLSVVAATRQDPAPAASGGATAQHVRPLGNNRDTHKRTIGRFSPVASNGGHAGAANGSNGKSGKTVPSLLAPGSSGEIEENSTRSTSAIGASQGNGD